MDAGSNPDDDQPEGAAGESRRYVESGLAVLGLRAGMDEIAVIEGVEGVYRPALDALMAEGFDGIPREPGIDMSRAPRTESER